MMTDIWAHCQSSTSTRPIGSFCKGRTYLAPVVIDHHWSIAVESDGRLVQTRHSKRHRRMANSTESVT